jgi:hypothetical protein
LEQDDRPFICIQQPWKQCERGHPALRLLKATKTKTFWFLHSCQQYVRVFGAFCVRTHASNCADHKCPSIETSQKPLCLRHLSHFFG